MKVKHRWIFLYDIKDPKRLRKVAKFAESFGNRVQKSVFEFYTDDFTLNNIEKTIKMMIEDEDSYAFIPACIQDWEKTVRYGTIKKEYVDPKDGEGPLFL